MGVGGKASKKGGGMRGTFSGGDKKLLHLRAGWRERGVFETMHNNHTLLM